MTSIAKARIGLRSIAEDIFLSRKCVKPFLKSTLNISVVDTKTSVISVEAIEDTTLDRHTHTFDESVELVQGTCVDLVNNRELSEGEKYNIEANSPHQIFLSKGSKVVVQLSS